MSERQHCEGCYVHNVCPGLPPCEACAEREESKRKWGVYPCDQCAAKNDEIARLTAERQELVESCLQLERERDALRDLGREMADAYVRCMDIGDKHFKTYATASGRALVDRWRSLGGKG